MRPIPRPMAVWCLIRDMVGKKVVIRGRAFARRWMDVARYAESVTLRGLVFKEAWRYRDYLLKSFGQDRPFDKMIREQIAGLLEDTVVWWGGEFGRTPYSEGKGTGRDHNPGGYTVWVAGGGFKAGYAHGETDEFGFRGISGRVHMHDLHATLLHQLGLDHKRLTYKHAGRDFRLTDVHGHVVHGIIA